jgi:hypothetical protein
MLKGPYLFQGQGHGNPIFYLHHLSLSKLFRPPTKRFHKFSTSGIMFIATSNPSEKTYYAYFRRLWLSADKPFMYMLGHLHAGIHLSFDNLIR